MSILYEVLNEKFEKNGIMQDTLNVDELISVHAYLNIKNWFNLKTIIFKA